MIEHVVLFQLAPGVDDERQDWMMRETRLRLLKIPAVLAVRCGKNIADSDRWGFFLAVTLESPSRLPAYADHPIHQKFVEEVIRPNTVDRLAADFETLPGEDPLFS